MVFFFVVASAYVVSQDGRHRGGQSTTYMIVMGDILYLYLNHPPPNPFGGQ